MQALFANNSDFKPSEGLLKAARRAAYGAAVHRPNAFKRATTH